MLGIGMGGYSGATLEQMSLPNENCNSSGEIIDGVWYYVYDLVGDRSASRLYLRGEFCGLKKQNLSDKGAVKIKSQC